MVKSTITKKNTSFYLKKNSGGYPISRFCALNSVVTNGQTLHYVVT